jgi:DNA-binding transcriptional ArsR family regulator
METPMRSLIKLKSTRNNKMAKKQALAQKTKSADSVDEVQEPVSEAPPPEPVNGQMDFYDNVDIHRLTEAVKRIFGFAEPTRIKILYALALRSMKLPEIERITGLKAATLSNHLQLLNYTSLIYVQTHGRIHEYFLSKLGRAALEGIHTGITQYITVFEDKLPNTN